MIKIGSNIINPDRLINEYSPGSIEQKTIEILSTSSEVYEYDSINQLKFELNLRMNIVKAAVELNNSDFSFRTFRKSQCNPEYWTRTDEGGFLIKEDVKPFDAINDILVNSSKYGTECATAIVIVYYLALARVFPEKLFNEMFPDLYLMNWKSLDEDLGIYTDREPKDYLPGDCRYFKNPDVDPLTPEWQGENVIDLGNGTYYGHGIGIENAEGIITALNRHRMSDEAESAHLMDSVIRPSFKYLSYKYYFSI